MIDSYATSGRLDARDNGSSSGAEFQRARLLAAATVVAAERGFEGISVAAVTATARMSRKTFYEFFDGIEDCYLTVCEEALIAMGGALSPPFVAPGTWPTRVRAALAAALEFLDAEPDRGILSVSYLFGGGPTRKGVRDDALRTVTDALQEGHASSGRLVSPSPVVAEMLIGGLVVVTHARLTAREGPLLDLLNPLMSMIVLPYLGTAAARRELRRARPRPPRTKPLRPSRSSSPDPWLALGIRMTHRTALVLAAISGSPGLSNASVAASAGIADAGQVSKLLSRLAGLGIIENTGVGQRKGGRNAWRLTATGREAFGSVSHDVASPAGGR